MLILRQACWSISSPSRRPSASTAPMPLLSWMGCVPQEVGQRGGFLLMTSQHVVPLAPFPSKHLKLFPPFCFRRRAPHGRLGHRCGIDGFSKGAGRTARSVHCFGQSTCTGRLPPVGLYSACMLTRPPRPCLGRELLLWRTTSVIGRSGSLSWRAMKAGSPPTLLPHPSI